MKSLSINNNYIKFGMIIFSVAKKNWELVSDIQRKSKSATNQSINNQSNPEFQNDSNLLYCRMQVRLDPIFNANNQYFLTVYESKDKNTNECSNQSEFHKIAQVQFKVLDIQISHKNHTLNQLLNLMERDYCRLFNPVAMEAPQLFTHITDSQGNTQVYYVNNIQTGLYFQIATQIWVRQKLLYQLTADYLEYYDKFKESKDYGVESNSINQRQRVVRQALSSLDEEKKKNAINQIQFSRILESIVREEYVKQGSHKVQQSFKERNYKLNSFLSTSSQFSSRDIQPYVSGDNQFDDKKKNSILSFNFADGKNSAGLFFDLNKDLTFPSQKPRGFNGQLKPYQARALTWMLFREGKQSDIGIDMTHIPFWWDAGSDLGLQQKLMVNTNLRFATWKTKIQKRCFGGILADQMGLGKTIMIIALILAHQPKSTDQTLIIAPLSVIKQWKDQINKFAPQLKVHVINQSKINSRKLLEFDVIITTEGKMRAQLKRSMDQYNQEQSVLMQHNWFRIVIDEAHNFKNSKTAMAKTVFELNSEYRWCLTGTPTQNSPTDIYSLIRFLRFMPWCQIGWWQTLFPKNIKKINSYHILKMKQLLKGIVLRRKKQSLDQNGNTLINIPKVDVKVHIVKMNQQAEEAYKIYDYRARQALDNLQTLQQKIKKTKSKIRKITLNQAKKIMQIKILALMTKMRMICCHQFLIEYKCDYIPFHNYRTQYLKFLKKQNVVRQLRYNFFQYYMADKSQKQQMKKPTSNLSKIYENWDERLHQILSGYKFPCLLCDNIGGSVEVTPCMHFFCRDCLTKPIAQEWQEHNLRESLYYQSFDSKQKFKKQKLEDFEGHCPHCGDKLYLRQVFQLPKLNQFGRNLEDFQTNQKIGALLGYLKKMSSNDKALVFTSFLGMMSLLHLVLQKERISHLTIQGSDSYQSRHQKISQFNKNPKIQVLILTLKTGSVGLNMQSANKVFFMDPWWNPAIQEQAIGRVHRIGQKKQVQAYKFITQSTIQARILKLSLFKKQMSDSILDIDDVVNDKRFSKSRMQMRFLLSVQETYDEKEEQTIKQENQYDKVMNNWQGLKEPFQYEHPLCKQIIIEGNQIQLNINNCHEQQLILEDQMNPQHSQMQDENMKYQ